MLSWGIVIPFYFYKSVLKIPPCSSTLVSCEPLTGQKQNFDPSYPISDCERKGIVRGKSQNCGIGSRRINIIEVQGARFL